MDALYRLLGIVARLSERMSHFRVNLIPTNIGLLIVCGIAAMMCGFMTLVGMLNSGPPQNVRIGDLLKHDTGGRTFIRVTGGAAPGEPPGGSGGR